MDLGRYYMRRMAMRVDTEHFQELCRTVAYAIDPAHTAYNFAVHYGVTDLPTPEEIWRAGTGLDHRVGHLRPLRIMA